MTILYPALSSNVYKPHYFQFEYGMTYTWDITSERFGWMFVWGDYVLVPFFYSLPGWWLIHSPDSLSTAGATAIILLFLFRNPERFAPDRFGSPDFEDKQHRYALIGFGGGKHRCMGKHFAYVQLKAIWTVLLDRFDFFLDAAVPAPNYGSWVTGPMEPCRLRYRRRREASVFR